MYNIGSHYVFIEVVALDRIRGLYFTITELTTYFLWREHKEGVESPGKGPEIVKVNLDEIQMISTALTWYCKDKKAISIHLVGEVDQIHPLEDNCRRERIWHLMIHFQKSFLGNYIFQRTNLCGQEGEGAPCEVIYAHWCQECKFFRKWVQIPPSPWSWENYNKIIFGRG